MAKVVVKLKTKKDYINKYSCLENDIVLYNLSKRNGFVKGMVDYGFIENFGKVIMPFQFAIYDNFSEEGFQDFTYEDGSNIPKEIYIWETIKGLNENKLLNK